MPWLPHSSLHRRDVGPLAVALVVAAIFVPVGASGSGKKAPTAPENLVVTSVTATSVTVAWNASTKGSAQLAGYDVSRDGAAVGTTGSTRYTVDGIACNASVTIGVDAYDQAGNHSPTVTVAATAAACPAATGLTSTADTSAPTAPSGLAVGSATAGSVSVSWNASTDNVAVSGYKVSRDGTALGTTSATSYTVSGLTCGTSYSIGVAAFDAANNASSTSSVTATTAACADPVTTWSPSPIGVPGNWTLKFDDEFDGSSLDTSKWSPCWFYPTCGSQNNVSTSPANVQVANGNLILTLASSSSGATVETNPSGGAGVGYRFQYGVVEARIWFPGDGSHCYNWPAWWTDGQSWPTNGENDIAEVLGGQMTVNYHSSSGAHNQGAVSGYWCGGYHTYAINRQSGHADVYYDGTLVKSYSTDDGGALQYLIINVGASDSYSAYGTASQVKVDYVRAWQ